MTIKLQDLTPGTPEWDTRVIEMEEEKQAKQAEILRNQTNANMKAAIKQRYKGFFDR